MSILPLGSVSPFEAQSPIQVTGVTPFDFTGLTPTSQMLGNPQFASPMSRLMSGAGLGANLPTFNAALGGLQSLGGLWSAYNAGKIAKKQLKFTKDVTNANLENQTQTYNTSIADRARARGVAEGQSQAQVDDYISRNSLQKRTVG